MNSLESKFEELFQKDKVPDKVTVPERKGVIEDFENIETRQFFEGKSWGEVSLKEIAEKNFFVWYLTGDGHIQGAKE